MMTDKPLAYWAAARLIEQSDYHRGWGDEEVRRCIIPPIEEGTYILGYYEDYNEAVITEPHIFATYAFPDQSHIDEYLRTGMFPKDGFYGQGNTPWVIDFICVSGMRDIMGGFRYLKAMFKNLGYENAQWLRTASNKRGWHKLKGE
jgi:hemolysin-activating ACP:hemolysin acyltransferase